MPYSMTELYISHLKKDQLRKSFSVYMCDYSRRMTSPRSYSMPLSAYVLSCSLSYLRMALSRLNTTKRNHFGSISICIFVDCGRYLILTRTSSSTIRELPSLSYPDALHFIAVLSISEHFSSRWATSSVSGCS